MLTRRHAIIGALACTDCGGLTVSNLPLNHASEGASLSNVARGPLIWSSYMPWGNGTFRSLASNGASVATMLARSPAFDALHDDSLPRGHNIAWFWCEAPEIHLDGSGNLVALKQHIASWVEARKMRGWVTVVKTVIPCGLLAGFEVARQDVNAWIRSGASGADLIDDWAAIWPGDVAANPELFDAEGIHTSAVGAELGARASSATLLADLLTR